MSDWDAIRYCGDAVIKLKLDDDDTYSGEIEAYGVEWHFNDVSISRQDMRKMALDSDEAFDKVAHAAVSYGSYYTSHNRAAGVPSWAPDAHTADEIERAVIQQQGESGEFVIRRRPWFAAQRPNPGRRRANPAPAPTRGSEHVRYALEVRYPGGSWMPLTSPQPKYQPVRDKAQMIAEDVAKDDKMMLRIVELVNGKPETYERVR